MIRIGVVDDHAIVRSALKQYLGEHVDFRVVGEASCAQGAIDLVRAEDLDVLLLDLAMPGLNAMDALAVIRQEKPAVNVLVLSAYPEDLYAATLVRMGAKGYLNKECQMPEIAAAVRTVALGGRYVSREVGEVLAKQLNRSVEKAAHETLSQREMQVFLRLAGGEKIGEIAKGMAVSVKTASTYRSRVMEKLCLTSNSELTRYAYANKLIH